MNVKTYRAGSMQEALQMVRTELGPEAAVLHTRQLGGGMLGWLTGSSRIEVTASTEVKVSSRFPETMHLAEPPPIDKPSIDTPSVAASPEQARFAAPPAEHFDYRTKFRSDIKNRITDLQSMVDDLCSRAPSGETDIPASLFALYTDLIDAEVHEDLARELIERVRSDAEEVDDLVLLKARIARLIEDEIKVNGPLQITPGQRRLVALVGPTGVGKTTTIAKLAANFRLREKRRVGLITVDTYRIAAVEQLRTYADIIDLPMEVVSTPREMRQAVERMSNMELILMDTAGRSPRDEVKIQELKSMLAESQADEVHLVLSSSAGSQSLVKTAEQFAAVGTTSLLLTKLDEATGLGNVLPLLRSCQLPLSYVTNGQNVPDDIMAADGARLAREVLGMNST